MKRFEIPAQKMTGTSRNAQRLQRLRQWIERKEAKITKDTPGDVVERIERKLDSYYEEVERRIGSKPGRPAGTVVKASLLGEG